MNIDVVKLRNKINEKNMSVAKFSSEIGIDVSTFYRKIEANGNGFTIGEVHKAAEVLELDGAEAVGIFLPQYSH